jgi:hypothetical protein
MRHAAAALILLAAVAPTARAQYWGGANLDRINRRIAGHVVDYTQNHGADRRIYSPILGVPRDLYVYLPPGYTPSQSYPLVLYLHMGYVDEHVFLGMDTVVEGLDRLIASGQFPPAIVACPDGVYSGKNRAREVHSFYLDGVGGRVESHLMQEVVPFLTRCYSVRPEREAHALFGASAGGFGALSLAIRHRDFFGAVATLAPPANARYGTTEGRYHANFDPATYRWRTDYDPDEIVGRFYFGLRRVRARTYIAPVFGDGPEVVPRLTAVNPADLIFSTDLRPGELAIYINYPGRDSWNFDAQAESFAWLAAQKGVSVTLDRIPRARHTLLYFRSNHERAFCWLAGHLLPPS